MTKMVDASSETFKDLLTQINLELARDPRAEQVARARRNAQRLGSLLGLIASTVALYDLSLLVGIGH